MSAIVLDARKVNSYVLPSLNKSESIMQTAYSTSVSLKNNFPKLTSHNSTINDIVNQIYNLKKEISDIEGIIESKLESAKRIESKSESRVSSIAAIAATIGGTAGTIGGAALGAATGGVVSTVAGAVVGAGVGSTVGKALVNTGAKIWDGATKVAKGIWNGIKDIGNKLWEGCKKIAKGVKNFFSNKVMPVLKNVGNALLSGMKKLGSKWLTYTKTKVASIANVAISVLKGLMQFGEALVDGVTMILGGVASIVTGIIDGCQAIYGAITGKEWHSLTKAMWTKKIMPFVSTQYVNSWAAAFYNTEVGKWLDENAIDWCKSDGIICEIGSGVGYVAGIILLTVATLGTGTIAVTTTQASTVIAGVAGAGKAASSNFNTIKGEDGTFDNVTGAQIAKAVAGSYASGAIEGFTWYYTYGTGAKVLEAGAKKIATKKFVSILFGSKIKAKMGLQFAKTFLNDGIINPLATEKEADWGAVLTAASVNAIVSGIYDKFLGGKIVGDKATALAQSRQAKILAEAALQDGDFTSGINPWDIEIDADDIVKNGFSKTVGKAVKSGYTSIIESFIDLFRPVANVA